MKITRKKIAELIKEETLKKLKEQDKMSRSQWAQAGRERGRDTEATKQVTPQELALIDQIEKDLLKAAKVKNLLSGDIAQRISKLVDLVRRLVGDQPETEEPAVEEPAAEADPEVSDELGGN